MSIKQSTQEAVDIPDVEYGGYKASDNYASACFIAFRCECEADMLEQYGNLKRAKEYREKSTVALQHANRFNP